ncbi:MAG: hypothetical protein EXS68_00485 [Candidatus Ryanbacteria bacterium]|nr:hypothetical protein [Candidatus Ryanbacteria bacterium]
MWIVIVLVAFIQVGFHKEILDSVKIWEGECTLVDATGLQLNFDCGEHKGRTSNEELIASVINGRRTYPCNLFKSGQVDCKVD